MAIKIDDADIQDLLKQLPKGIAISATVRGLNQTISKLNTTSRKALRLAGVTAAALRNKYGVLQKQNANRTDLSRIRSRLSVRQGRQAGLKRFDPKVVERAGKRAGVEVQLRKKATFEHAFMMQGKRTVFQRVNGRIEPVTTPGDDDYSESAAAINKLWQTLPKDAQQMAGDKIKQNLQFLIARRKAKSSKRRKR